MHTLNLDAFNPAPAQGTIALESHINNQVIIEKLIALNHAPTSVCAALERLTMKALGEIVIRLWPFMHN